MTIHFTFADPSSSPAVVFASRTFDGVLFTRQKKNGGKVIYLPDKMPGPTFIEFFGDGTRKQKAKKKLIIM